MLLFNIQYNCVCNNYFNIVSDKMYKIKVVKINNLNREKNYFNGIYIELLDAPIPGFPWRTGVLVIEYSPR